MPVDIALPSSFHSEKFIGSTCSRNTEPSTSHERFSAEVKSGNMTIVEPNGRKQKNHIKIYRTSSEHFAVIFPQKKVCKPLGVLNLRNTSVERFTDESTPGLIIRQRGFDNTASLSFISEDEREVESWITAFTSRASPTILQSCLPVVQEDEEN